jgi:TetR/AcrR family transcriptional regulator, mexCD-oprJ operon repressor
MPEPATDHRRATAERNIEAILDAAEALLERRAAVTIAAVATESGVSRVTVYAHFPTLERLLEAVVERAVQRSTTALDAAEPNTGPVLHALDRVVAAAWRALDRHAAIAEGAAARLSPGALARAHEAGHRWLHDLIERGHREGDFRTDLPTEWLVTSCFAVIHACGEQVRAGKLDPATAEEVLTATIRSILTAPTAR